MNTVLLNITILKPLHLLFSILGLDLHDSRSATYLAVIAMVMVLVVLSIEKYHRGKASYKIESTASEVKKQRLTGYKLYLSYFFLSLPVIFGFLIPLIWIAVYSYEYAAKLLDDKFLTILTNSLYAASLSAFIIMSTGICCRLYQSYFPNHGQQIYQ